MFPAHVPYRPSWARPGPVRARWLVIMAKSPLAGRVKSRLARDVGVVAATAFYRHASRATIARLAADSRWRTVVAVAPDRDVAAPHWPRNISRIAQGPGDIGARMQRLLECMPPGPVVVIGTDVPGIERSHIATAFQLLGDHDAVFGPAEDGGYWLVGQRRTPRPLRAFTGVRWSSEHALADTLARHRRHRTAFVARLADVDTGADLAAQAAWCGRQIR